MTDDIRCSGNLCDDIPRVNDGTHYYCKCGESARRDLRAQGIDIPEGHWVHVFAAAPTVLPVNKLRGHLHGDYIIVAACCQEDEQS